MRRLGIKPPHAQQSGSLTLPCLWATRERMFAHPWLPKCDPARVSHQRHSAYRWATTHSLVLEQVSVPFRLGLMCSGTTRWAAACMLGNEGGTSSMLFPSQKNRHAGNHALNVRPQSGWSHTLPGCRSGLGLEPWLFIVCSLGSGAALGVELAQREWHLDSVLTGRYSNSI